MTVIYRSTAVTLCVEERDRLKWVGHVAMGGLAAAGALAFFGPLPFDIPMPTHAIGWVEPTCGLTRGSTAIARGDLALAWRYNPASFLVIGVGVLGIVRLVWGVVTGRWLNARCHLRPLAWAAVAVAVAVLWAHQQGNAQFVMSGRS